jgi:hypothetical protein
MSIFVIDAPGPGPGAEQVGSLIARVRDSKKDVTSDEGGLLQLPGHLTFLLHIRASDALTECMLNERVIRKSRPRVA